MPPMYQSGLVFRSVFKREYLSSPLGPRPGVSPSTARWATNLCALNAPELSSTRIANSTLSTRRNLWGSYTNQMVFCEYKWHVLLLVLTKACSSHPYLNLHLASTSPPISQALLSPCACTAAPKTRMQKYCSTVNHLLEQLVGCSRPGVYCSKKPQALLVPVIVHLT